MWRAIEWIDEKILAFFTRVSHRFQILTGRTNFFLAKVCLLLIAGVMMLDILNYLHQILAHPTPFLGFCGWLMLSLGAFDLVFWCDKLEHETLDNHDAVFHFHYMPPVFRVCFLAAGCWHFFSNLPNVVGAHNALHAFLELMWAFFLPLMVVFNYFMAVTSLPPVQGKVKEWLQSLAAGFLKLAPAKK